MPRLLQEALWFDGEEQADDADSEGEGHKVDSSSRGVSWSGAGLVQRVGPARILDEARLTAFRSKTPAFGGKFFKHLAQLSNLLTTGFVAQTERTWTPERRFLWDKLVCQNEAEGRSE